VEYSSVHRCRCPVILLVESFTIHDGDTKLRIQPVVAAHARAHWTSNSLNRVAVFTIEVVEKVFSEAHSRASKPPYAYAESKPQMTKQVTDTPRLLIPLLRQEFPVLSDAPILTHGRRVFRHNHIRYIVTRTLDGHTPTEIARELIPDAPEPTAHRVRGALKELEKDASLFRTVGIVEPVVVSYDGEKVWYCLIHGDGFSKANEANNHCWVTFFVELAED
jgi:hypothetical protein